MGTTITPVQEVSQTLMSMKPEFAEMLKKTGISPEKFTRVAIMSVQQKPELMQCTKNSLYKAFSDCARDGLIPDGSEAAIVKFGNDAVFMPMVEGILKQCRNSGELGCIDAQVVFEKDSYDSYTDEKGVHFKHTKSREKDRGKPILVFAYALTKDGHLYFEEMTEEEVMAVRNIAKTKMVWDGTFKYEMWRKSGIRRLSKRLPKNTDLENFIAKHDKEFEIEDTDAQPDKTPEQTTSTRLTETIEATATAAHSDAPPPDAVDAPLPATEPAQENKKIRGVIEKNTQKSGNTAGKPWVRYGGLIEGAWYGSFDSKIYDMMVKSQMNKILIEMEYVEVVKDNKIYFEVKKIHQVTASEAQTSGDIPF
jgi:recombination protein RecT